jgi:glutathione peroxidase
VSSREGRQSTWRVSSRQPKPAPPKPLSLFLLFFFLLFLSPTPTRQPKKTTPLILSFSFSFSLLSKLCLQTIPASTTATALFGLGGGAATKEKTDTVYDFTVTGIDGNKIPLSKYKGKVLVVVNVASACGFTPQYAGFQDLVSAYGKKGLEVLFFPCNQFGSQEPGSNADVKSFAAKQGFKGVMMAKVDVNGNSAEPLFQFMKQKQGGLLTSDIKWNFSKFLIDREGNVVGRYASTATPESLKKDIEKYL